MTIQQEIVAWAASRPDWQQTALCRLAAGKQWDDAELKALLQDIKAGASGGQALTQAAIPVATSTAATVSLLSIRDLKNVNALVPAQDLNFAETGLTVIYGDNASGKSGYARLIKSAVRSLHHEPVHGNVFAAQPEADQHAEILYHSGSDDKKLAWPSQGPGGPECDQLLRRGLRRGVRREGVGVGLPAIGPRVARRPDCPLRPPCCRAGI